VKKRRFYATVELSALTAAMQLGDIMDYSSRSGLCTLDGAPQRARRRL
jgi:hypothetical protein